MFTHNTLYIYIFMCLHISEMNNSNAIGLGEKNQDHFVILSYLHYLRNIIVLFESELEIFVNVFSKSRITTKKSK